MTTRKLLALPATLALLHASPLVLAQANRTAAELDITITVMEEGQTPAGFIQQLELPAPDTLDAAGNAATESAVAADAAAAANAEAAAGVAVTVDDIGGAAAETVTNLVRETISIDGTAAVGTQPNLVPGPVLEALDEDLPLVDGIDEGVGGVLPDPGGVTDGVGGIVDGVTEDAGGLVDGVTGDGGGLTGTLSPAGDILPVTDGADAIVDNLDAGIGEVVPLVDDAVNTVPDDGALDALPGAAEAVSETVTTGTDAAQDAVSDTVDEAVNTPDPAASLDSVTDNLPGLLP